MMRLAGNLETHVIRLLLLAALAMLLLPREVLARDDSLAKLEKKHGKGKALSIIAHRLGRCVYFILKRRKPFRMAKFFNN